MKERPILFSGAMVRAILAGAKIQTRRVVKAPGWSSPGKAGVDFGCPYGGVGDRLWVRESFSIYNQPGNPQVFYKADSEPGDPLKYKPSIHMPRWASRITLEVTDVRVERLQDICEEDARAEGITDGGCLVCGEHEPCGCTNPTPDARDSFINLWDSINAQRGYSWSSDPWVWVVAFKKI